MPTELKDLELFAWVGEDELGSGEIGLKQAIVPAGVIPIVAVSRDKVDRLMIAKQMDEQGRQYDKQISLCRFTFAEVIKTVG
jgi:hypothetical protein